MAGQAGNVSAFNTVWTYGIYRSVLNKNASDAHLLWMGRVSTIVGVVLSLITAYWAKSFPSIMDYMQAIFSWVNAPLFATMLSHVPLVDHAHRRFLGTGCRDVVFVLNVPRREIPLVC